MGEPVGQDLESLRAWRSIFAASDIRCAAVAIWRDQELAARGLAQSRDRFSGIDVRYREGWSYTAWHAADTRSPKQKAADS
jgi:hypothetical protein